jgi:hypothetical protein
MRTGKNSSRRTARLRTLIVSVGDTCGMNCEIGAEASQAADHASSFTRAVSMLSPGPKGRGRASPAAASFSATQPLEEGAAENGYA